MELQTTIYLVLGGLLLFFILMSFFLLGGQKKKKAEGTAAKKPIEILPEPEAAEHENLESFTLPDLFQVEYRSLEMVARPKKMKEMDAWLKTNVRKMLDNVPPQPDSSIQLANLLLDPQVSTKQIASLVSTNPLISSSILRTVNSPYFGLSTKVTSVGRAITLLGFNNIHSIVMRDAMCIVLPTDGDNELDNTNALWLHSTVVAACSLYLSKNVLPYSEHDMGTIGLFHDIGKYFLASVESRTETELEMSTLVFSTESGIDHALLGSMLAEHWQMAEIVIKCIEYHHYPTFFPLEDIPDSYLKPVFIVCLADLICRALGYMGQDKELLSIRQEYYEKFGLQPDPTKLVSHSLLKEIEKARITVESYLEGYFV